ncbi:MAG: putative Ig domain-containing protein [Verrucomicrobia bacterium]|nr:putative Ig domain-containing protein [Verrucomicrobiota bacterium]
MAISADGGVSWYEVQPLRSLTSTYTQYSVNLDQEIAARGLSYSTAFKIRFNQYGSDYIPYQGIGIDDVLVTANPVGLLLTAPPQATEGAGALSGTVALSAVRASDTVVSLASSAPAKLTVPATVTVPAGQLSATFALNAPDDTILDGNRSVTIIGSAAGLPTSSVSVLVIDNDAGSLALSVPASATETAGTVSGGLSLASVPVGTITVALSSSDPTAATVPSSVTFAPGQTTVSFPITIVDDSKIDGPQTTTITASVVGWPAAAATLTVNDNENTALSLSGFGNMTEGTSASGYLGISGTLAGPLVVTLTSTNPSRLAVPGTVTIPAGTTAVYYTLSAPDNAATDGSEDIAITASAAGFTPFTIHVMVLDNDVHHFGVSTVAPSQQTNVPFSVTISAFDINNNPLYPFTGTAGLTAAGSTGAVTVVPGTTTPFYGGQWTGPVSIGQAASNVRLTATNGTATGISNAFAVTQSPTLTLNPTSLAVSVSPGATATRTLTLGNSGGGILNWSLSTAVSLRGETVAGPVFSGAIQPLRSKTDPAAQPPPYRAPRAGAAPPRSLESAAPPALGAVLSNLNVNHPLVRSAIPGRYAFSEGIVGTYISDGGNDMYDGGNQIDTNLAPGAYLNYSDNAIVPHTALGSGGQYFTRKYDGLWVLAADVSGLDYFEITGNLGADGSGSTDTAVFTLTYNGTSYRGFLRRVYNAGDPSVNHLIIVPDNGTVTHEASTSTDSDYHRATNLSGITRIYYLLYAGTAGAYIDNAAAQNIMAAFLDAATTPDWVTPSQFSGAIASGATQAITLTVGGTALTAGSYTRNLLVTSNDPVQPQATLPISLTVLGPPTITTQPLSQTVVAGSDATFSVVAGGAGPFTYQWRRNGSDLSGATSAALTLASVPFGGGGAITVLVSNGVGSVVSNAATLTVNPVAPVITSPLTASAVTGRAFLYQITASSSSVTYAAAGLPPGLTLNTSTGVISGSPVAAGTANIALTASNVSGADTRTLVLTVQPPPPVITSPATASGRVGAALSFAVTATNSPASFDATALPPGLTINPATGLIGGTPTTAGTFTAVVGATNGGGSASSPLVITIGARIGAPVFTGSPQISGVKGSPLNFSPSFSNAPTAFSLVSGALPTGISLNSTTGALSGTPTQSGAFNVTLNAANAVGSVTIDLALIVNPAPGTPVITSSSLANATVGTAFGFTLTATGTPTSFSAPLPLNGLSLNPATGVISGTPTSPATLRLPVSATNSAGTGASVVLVITVRPSAGAPVLTSAPLVVGRVGDPLTYRLTGTNITGATSFAVSSGTLPPAVTLDAATGIVSGTPTQSGRTEVWFVAANAGSPGLALGVVFDIASAASTPVITSNGTATLQVGRPFSYAITATGSPTSFAVGALPTGLSLASATGIISGFPAESTGASFSTSVTATNAAGTSSPKPLEFSFVPASGTPLITSALTASGLVGGAFSYQVTASDSPTSFAALNLPAGLALNTASGLLSGTPVQAGSFNVTLRATNTSGLGLPAVLALTIGAAPSAPSITSAASAVGKVDTDFLYTIVTNGTATDFGVTPALPLGLALNTSTGVISGRPVEVGTYTVQLVASFNGASGFPQPLVIVIAAADAAPVITSSLSAQAVAGTVFSYQITASNPPLLLLDAVNLPPGLAVNPSTGVIQGTPTTPGTFVATLVGTNAAGTGPQRDLTIVVRPASAAPVITSGSTAAGGVGLAFSYQIAATNSPTSYEVLGAPTWMTTNNLTGALAGTPSAPGGFVVQLLARNAAGASDPFTLTGGIAPAAGTPVVTSVHSATGTVGTAFSYQIGATNSPTSYAVSGLPSGLTLNSATGAITGTPSASGTFPVTLSATNANGVGAAVKLVLTIQSGTQILLPGP